MMGMNATAATLSDDDIRDVVVFVAGRDACQVGLKIDHRREGFRAAFIAGRQKYVSANCAHCHQSFHHHAPRLVGQKAGFLAKALQQFKVGERQAPMMTKLLKTWTSEDFNKSAFALQQRCQFVLHHNFLEINGTMCATFSRLDLLSNPLLASFGLRQFQSWFH